MKEKKAWRPTVMTEKVVKKLEDWFIMGFTDLEACLYAEISKQSLYDYCKKYPAFTDRKEMLKDNLKMVAKTNLSKTINWWDSNDSKWYLERKGKDEFSLKIETKNETVVDLNINIAEITDDELDKIINW